MYKTSSLIQAKYVTFLIKCQKYWQDSISSNPPPIGLIISFILKVWNFQMEADHPESIAGHNPKLFNDQQAIKKYICAICNNVLKDAVQIPQLADPKRACHDCYTNNTRYAPIQFCSWKCSHSKFLIDINWY